MIKVLITDQYSEEALAHLQVQKTFEVCFSREPRPSLEELRGVQALLIRSRTLVDQELLIATPDLQLVISSTSGTDHIDFSLCEQRGVTVLNTVEANAQSAAELTLLLILNVLRNIQQVELCRQKGQWRSDLARGFELAQKKLGLVGLGRVGKKVARIAQAFGAQVSAYDPYVSAEEMESWGVQALELNSLLKSSDIVSLHTSYSSETHHLIHKDNMNLMSPKAVLINTARGAVVEEEALIQSLKESRLAGAGLDVFAVEPLPQDSVLRSLKNVIITPHLGAYTHEALAYGSMEAVGLLLKHFKPS